jgi:multidrug efflux pump subunit AcrA (membrane-fusion protein)
VDYAEVRLPLPDHELSFLDLPLVYRGEAARSGGSGDSGSGNAPGAEVILKARFAGREREWFGRLVRTEGELDRQSRMVHVIAQVEDPYGRGSNPGQPPLAVGLFVEAEILGRTANDVVVVPRSAVRGQSQVYVINDEALLEFRDVQILKAEREAVVVDAGLADGERICLSPLDTAVDGMKVRTVDVGLPPELVSLLRPSPEAVQEGIGSP